MDGNNNMGMNNRNGQYQQNQYQQPQYQQNQYQQPQYQQNQYQQPQYSGGPGTELETPVSVGEWMVTFLISVIPCVGLIMLFVWAFGSNSTKSKSNWAKAELLWMLIMVVLSVIIYVIVGAAMFSAIKSSY